MKKKIEKSSKKILDVLSTQIHLVVAGLVVLMVIQFFNNAHLAYTMSQVSSNNQQMIDEVGVMAQTLGGLGNDLNEVREYLLLPTRDYNTSLITQPDAVEEGEEDATGEDPIVEIFSLIETIGESEQIQARTSANQAALDAYLNAEESLAFFAQKGLSLRNGIEHHLADDTGTVYLTLGLRDNGDIYMTSYSRQTIEFTEEDFEEVKSSIVHYIENDFILEQAQVVEVGVVRQSVYALLTTDATLQTLFAEKKLTVTTEREIADYFAYDLLDAEGMTVQTIGIERLSGDVGFLQSDFTLEPIEFENKGIFVNDVAAAVEALDTRTPIEKNITSLKESIESLREDEGFAATLENYGLTFTFDPVETETAWEYPILRSDGSLLRTLYIDKATGELMIKEPGSETGSLLYRAIAVESEGMTSLPDLLNVQDGVIESDTDINILVGGKHGSNVDTLIFANIDTVNQKITMVSIPRDLYYNGRKINSVYADYGMEELSRQISDISGYKIDRYILVDMYVFIDLIDLVGGIDVTLEEDLIDPTYKTFENGVAGTLYYKAGDHHFNGVEALRIARSRHTTSDYSRAERQQIILGALKDKAQDLGFGDAKTVISLVKTVLDQTETNIGLEEALQYYFRYQNFALNRAGVLSSGNVLASAKEPVNFPTSLRIDSCAQADIEAGTCQIQYAVYTLVPQDNNWDYIKGYFREALTD